MHETKALPDPSPAEPLDARHLQAILALLRHPSVPKAAQAIGIDRATLYRWIKQPAFHRALTDARSHAQAQALANLQLGTESAAALLLDSMRDPKVPIASRIRAAEAVLQSGGKVFARSHLDPRLAPLQTPHQ